MGSHPDSKKRKSPAAQENGRVVQDERGNQIWQGTIRTVKLSLMKTGIFHQSDAQQRLLKLRETGTDDADIELNEELEFIDDEGECDPYDSTKK